MSSRDDKYTVRLFVGGVWDGEVHDVEKVYTSYRVALKESAVAAREMVVTPEMVSDGMEEYHLQALECDGDQHLLFAISGLKDQALMDHLMADPWKYAPLLGRFMPKLDEDGVFRKAAALWGDLQLEMVIEECAELITALQHLKRGRASIAEVAEECADVTIMMEQLRLELGPARVDQIRDRKMLRLRDRIDSATS